MSQTKKKLKISENKSQLNPNYPNLKSGIKNVLSKHNIDLDKLKQKYNKNNYQRKKILN